MTLPRRFIARNVDAGLRALEPAPLAHAVDVFVLGNAFRADRECVVAVNQDGQLELHPTDDRDGFTESVQRELAFHEVSSGVPLRKIEASELYLFDLQVVEQPSGGTSPNDPVFLYGMLSGPYPGDGRVHVWEGQLTVPRVELVDAFAACAPIAFHFDTPRSEASQPSSRALHAMLSADRDETIGEGRGLVLAYPLLPVDALLTDGSNDVLVGEILRDLLSAMAERNLPRPPKSLGQSIVSLFRVDRWEVPDRAPLDAYLELARAMLACVPDEQCARGRAVRARVTRADTAALARSSNPVIHAQPVYANAVTPPRATPIARRDPSEWMRDFKSGHAAQSAGVSKVTAPAVRAQRVRESPARPTEKEWMRDFAQHEAHTEHEPQRARSPSAQSAGERADSKPDWMKDFE